MGLYEIGVLVADFWKEYTMDNGEHLEWYISLERQLVVRVDKVDMIFALVARLQHKGVNVTEPKKGRGWYIGGQMEPHRSEKYVGTMTHGYTARWQSQ